MKVQVLIYENREMPLINSVLCKGQYLLLNCSPVVYFFVIRHFMPTLPIYFCSFSMKILFSCYKSNANNSIGYIQYTYTVSIESTHTMTLCWILLYTLLSLEFDIEYSPIWTLNRLEVFKLG